jgi:3-oxoacyl-(acyl-carrier-protein) synthase
VPPPESRPAWFAHPRLRRTSPVAQYAVGAAVEALGDAARAREGVSRIGIVLCAMTGCVIYSRRFYDEVLKNPGTASPLMFPETVFNSPASHLAALLGTTAINYTLVGDPGTFLTGLALAADWLSGGRVEGCLVIGVEEADWLLADAFRLFSRRLIIAEGAGAVYLSRAPAPEGSVQLDCVTSPHLFLPNQPRAEAARRMCAELGPGEPTHLLCDSTLGSPTYDQPESSAWEDWPGPRLSPKRILGEGLSAGSAWQCVAAIDALRQGRARAATVSVVGCNQQALGARFIKA